MVKLKKGLPDTMSAFNLMAKAASKSGSLEAKTKELIALGIGVAARCDACLRFHTQSFARLGATREEVTETLGMAIYTGGGPSLMHATDVLRDFEQALDSKQEVSLNCD